MKVNKSNRVRTVSGTFAALLAIFMVLSMASTVFAQQAVNTPTLTVGNSAYFGGISDIGEDYQDEMEDALQEIEDMGFDVKFDANGGAGAYVGWEIASNSAMVNDYECYDIAIMGAFAIDFGIDASVKGTVSESGMTVSMDGDGDAFVKFEAVLDGHLFVTVDDLAIAKLQLSVTAEGEFGGNLDATMSYVGESMSMKGDASGSIDNAQIDFLLEFDPPLDMYQFPVTQGESWYVPAEETTVSGSINAQGTMTYDYEATMTGEDPMKDGETVNLADQIGDNDFSEIIPGGEPEDYYGYEFGGGTMFTCTQVVGDTFVMELDMSDMMDMGTRQFDFLDDPASMIPSMGLQFDAAKGMISGVVMDGVAITESTTKAAVEDFISSPLETVTAETGGSAGGLDMMMVILVVVIIVVVVVVVVVAIVARGKKTPPTPPPQQPLYGPQPGYEQPPPQYPAPQQYPPQGQYPPPPPPPGQ